VLSVVWDCFFDGTSSDSVGGGMYIESPESLAIINSVFYRTKASRGGGGIYTSQPSKCYFKNCVFHSDTSSTGGAILLYFSSIPLSPPLISDNIFDNSNYPQNSVVYSNRSSVIFEYNRVPGSGSIVGFPLSGTNATGEPMFAYTTPTDFRLKLDSPCIDTGEPDSLYRDDDLSKCDMGVFGGPGAINPARPRKVEFLTVRADTSGIRLAWNPVIYPAFIKYAIYRENYPGFLPVELNGRSHRIDTTSSLTYLDSIIVGPADVFCYRVNAFINDTLVAGGYSNEACTTPLKIDETSTTKPELELLVYPNPFNSVVKLESPKGSEIEIFNTNGTLLCKLPQSSNFWLPSSEIPSGVYIIKAKTKEKILTKPVIYLK
ncbi:MAG: T9SS type A sorting domain-containing protein, partial [bacterium]